MENKCPNCSLHLQSPKHFSCTHILCPFCYTRKLFSENIRNLSLTNSEITCLCPECIKGKLVLSLKEFSSYFSQNRIPNKTCHKHNKPTICFCKDCNIHLCDECISLFHADYFKSHEIVTMPEIFSLMKKCQKHNKIFEFLCFHCKEEICSDCLEKHHSHDIYEINDIIARAIGTTRFKEYNDYLNYLTQKEIALRDTINADYNKNIIKIEIITQNLCKLKQNYTLRFNKLFATISEHFNFLKNLYYFYYLSLNLNSLKNNIILPKYVYLMNKSKDNLVNQELLNFLDLNLFSHNTINFLENIQENIFNFDNVVQPFECKLNKLVFKFKRKFSFKNKDAIVDFQNLNNKNILVATKTGKIFHFSLENFTILNEIKAHDEKISKIFITNKNENNFKLISSSFDKTIKFHIFSNNNFVLKHTFKGHKGGITCMILIKSDDENNEFFMTGSADNNLKLWSLHDFKCVKTLTNGHKAAISDIAQISLKNIVSIAQDKNMIVWNLEKFAIEILLDNFYNFANINKMILLEDNKILLSANNNKNLIIFNLKNKKISNLKFIKNNEKVEIYFLFKMTNFNCFLTCRSENIIEIWNSDLAILNPEKNSCESILYGHTSSVNCAICLENDDFIVSGDENGTIFVWENTIVKDFIEDEIIE